MAFYAKLLRDLIEAEKQGKQYRHTPKDRLILDEMFTEINRYAGTNFHYLAELDTCAIPGSGEIMAKYVWRLETQFVRAMLLPQMVAERILLEFAQSPDRDIAQAARKTLKAWEK